MRYEEVLNIPVFLVFANLILQITSFGFTFAGFVKLCKTLISFSRNKR